MRKLIFTFLAMAALCQMAQSQSYNNPESIAYDAVGKRYFISNKAGNSISQLSSTNELTNFVTTGLKNPKGLLIVGDMLISVNNTTVQGFLLTDASKVFNVAIAGSIWMNDVAADKKGNIYVSDSETGKIHKISLATGEYSTLTNIPSGPNGLFYNANSNSLLICASGNNAKIFSYDLSTSTLKTVITTGFSDLDGLARDNCGNYYVSSWGTNSVYAYDSLFQNPPTVVSKGNNGPADISINEADQVLAIPNFMANTISLINLNKGCGKITNLLPQNNSTTVFKDSLKIDWDDIAGVTIYELQYCKDSTFTTSVLSATSNLSALYIKALSPGSKYYWRVRPTNGNEKSIFNKMSRFSTATNVSSSQNKLTDVGCKVFPNPSSGVFTLKIDEASAKNAEVAMHNASGKLLFSRALGNGIVDLSGHPKGIYMAKITIGKKAFAEKIVVK